MTLDLGRILSRTFSICWRHKWLWLLGVFGGGFGGGVGIRGGFNYNPFGGGGRGTGRITSAQVSAFLQDWLWLLVAIAVVLALIAIAGFLVACVAVPASIWAGLQLDADQPATLRTAWSQGTRRFGRYLRLYLLRFLISLGVFAVASLLVGVGILIFAGAGRGALVVLIPLGILLLVAYLAISLLLMFLFAWSERTAFILDIGAVEALRSSARLARRAWVDTLLFAIVMGILVGLLSIVIAVVGLVVAVPGIVALIFGITSNSTVLAIVGVLWTVILGGGAFLAGGGFLGSLVQVSYALACRDLCQHLGMQLSPTIPVASVPTPSVLTAPPPAPA